MNIVNKQLDELTHQLTLEIAAADYAEAEKKKLHEIRRKVLHIVADVVQVRLPGVVRNVDFPAQVLDGHV